MTFPCIFVSFARIVCVRQLKSSQLVMQCVCGPLVWWWLWELLLKWMSFIVTTIEQNRTIHRIKTKTNRNAWITTPPRHDLLHDTAVSFASCIARAGIWSVFSALSVSILRFVSVQFTHFTQVTATLPLNGATQTLTTRYPHAALYECHRHRTVVQIHRQCMNTRFGYFRRKKRSSVLTGTVFISYRNDGFLPSSRRIEVFCECVWIGFFESDATDIVNVFLVQVYVVSCSLR